MTTEHMFQDMLLCFHAALNIQRCTPSVIPLVQAFQPTNRGGWDLGSWVGCRAHSNGITRPSLLHS